MWKEGMKEGEGKKNDKKGREEPKVVSKGKIDRQMSVQVDER
jgi:hypothetical protein